MDVDLNVTYTILRELASRAEPIQYGELSRRYERRTGERVDPRLGWSVPLLRILEWCQVHQLPQLSALVVNEEGMPGAGFWGQGDVPATPSLEAWVSMCRAIQSADWPDRME